MSAGANTGERDEDVDNDYIVIPIEEKFLDGYSNGVGKRRYCGNIV